jgi:hypothetical protein
MNLPEILKEIRSAWIRRVVNRMARSAGMKEL